MPTLRDLNTPHRLEQIFEVIRRILGRDTTVTATTTLRSTHTTILADATAGAITINLPPAAQNPTRIYVIKKIDASANAVTVDGYSTETIDGAATYVLAARWNGVIIYSDGSNWIILSAV